MPYKKLIESLMPVAAINRESEREKTARNGLPSGVHMWWSRRSMACARSVLFASLVDDPAEHPERFSKPATQTRERKRLLRMVEELAVVENATNEELLQKARKEIEKYANGETPVVFDPFSGGGTVSVEALRLGLKAEASDLNPVAATITTVVADIPARFSSNTSTQALAEDVRFYGSWMLERARKKLGKRYPKICIPATGNEVDVSAWIWARTVKCPNPSCGCNIPLSSGYDLAKKKGSEAWAEPVVENGDISFVIHREPHTGCRDASKMGKTAVFKCPVCGEVTPDAYVKECGIKHQIASKLIAVVADDGKQRFYLEPNEEQIKASQTRPPKTVPHGRLPDFPKRFSPPGFGFTDYADLFTSRQLGFLTTMFQLAKEAGQRAEKKATASGMTDDGIDFKDGGTGAHAYGQAVQMCLALTVSKLLDRCSNMCSWSSSSGGSLRNVFSRAAMPMIWDYAEGNPLSTASGSFATALERTYESISSLPSGTHSKTGVWDATEPNTVRNAILSTDLPYYDKASYADLSDFFYVWLKFGIGDLFPEWFASELTSKREELTAFTHRWNGDGVQANAFYGEGLDLVFHNLAESATEALPSTVSYIYKRDHSKSLSSGAMAEWEALISAVSGAGFDITASWSIGRKYEDTVLLSEERGIPITLVIRKREEQASDTTRRFFVAALKRELPVIIKGLSKQVDIRDLRTSVIGPALHLFTRYRRVLDADGTSMKPEIASRIIEQEIDTILERYYDKATTEEINEEDNIHG